MADAIRVCVRCRPLNAREKARGAVPLIRIQGNTCHLDPDPKERSANAKAAEKETKSFSFDRAFDSQDKSSPDYASQQIVFDYLGRDLLNHAFEGFNCGIFAYGQTGSGKSYSMMGYGEERGIIPLTCEELFRRIEAETTDTVKYSVSVSFMEIYNEKVRDLLNPKNKGNLRVREHPSLGVYVEDLAKLVVRSYGEVEALMEEGNQARTVAATNMNETSSRSHSIFTLLLTQTRKDQATGLEGEKVSKISLIDLAGSERANSTGATGTRLKEGANINRSLTTLGKVIAALAASPGKGKKDEFVPFRDSVLTWLLKDSLGGNSKTAMIAALSSADYEETLSTLRYADSAKKIKTRAVVNEDPTAKLIRELKEELTSLRTQMGSAVAESTYDPTVPPEKQIVQYKSKTGEIKTVTKAELEEQLGQSEKLLADVNQTWEEKLEETQKIQVERERALEELGISIEKNQVGVHPPKRMPHLVNLNEDPLMSECLIYQIKPGKTTVGNLEATAATDIRLSGEGIREEHCYFTNEEDGVVLLHALPDGVTMVNGRRLQPDKPRPLKSGYRIIIGEWHVFRFNHPLEVQKVRDRIKNAASEDATASPVKQEPTEESRESRPGSPAETMAEDADWNFARREVLRVNGMDIDLDTLPDQDLHILSKNLERVRGSRKSASISGRPESRMSYLFEEDEDDSTGSPASRPFSSNQTWSTADTSEGPGAASFGLPDLDDRLIEVRQEMEAQLADQRIEYEEKLKTMENGAMSSHDIEIERSVMQTQLATVQKEMKAQLELQREQYEKRLQRAQKGKRLVFADDEDEYTEQEKALLKNSITQWRTHTLVKVAEETLAHAVHLKEANVISQELGKDVSFQFAVGQRSLLGLNSAMSQLAVAEEASEPQMTDKITGLLVRVTDLRNKTITLWSLARFMHHLEAMRKLYKFVDQPSYSRHLDYDEPFRSIDHPLYSAIGFASVSLAPINCNVPSSTLAPIICPFTLEAIGRCRIRLQPKSSVTPSAGSQSSDPATVSRQRVLDGTHLTYIILVDEFEGLSADQLSHVHCQVRKSAFLPADAQSPEEITVSEELVLGQRSISKLQLYKEVTLRMDAGVRHHLSRNFLAVEVFGRPTAEFLSYIEAWDTTLVSKSRSVSKGQAGRRPEAEMIAEQRHDVLAHIYVCELDANGSYLPVPVVSSSARDPGAFHLRHGLQRQVVVELKHSSGRAWPWLEIDEVTLGDVRLLDAKGLVHASPTRDPLILKALDKERAMYESDGTSRLSFTATWDSSAHGSTFLNRTTPPSSYVLVKVSWTVKGAGHEPVPFNCDIALSVQSRDAKPPSKFFSMFSTNRTLSDRCTLFSVSLKPPPAPLTADQLWRRDTSEVYVRGEEILKKWKPHSVGLVEAYRDAVERESKRAQSEATRCIVEAIPKTSLLSGSYGQDEESKLAKALEQWQSWHFLNTKVQLKQAPSKIVRKKSSKGKEKPRKRIGTASIIPSNDVVVKKSHLSILRDPSNSDWERAFYSLRRPYLYIYESSSESKLKTVINIETVRVETNQELSVMTGRKFVWALYTPTNCYFMQADSANHMSQWMVALDPGYQQ